MGRAANWNASLIPVKKTEEEAGFGIEELILYCSSKNVSASLVKSSPAQVTC